MSLTVQEKAKKYLSEGKVLVVHVDSTSGAFLVQGSASTAYAVNVFSTHGWGCTCPARVEKCAHIQACELITAFKIEQNTSLGTPSEEIAALLAD